jgi:Cu/Ag efflux protein CusF
VFAAIGIWLLFVLVFTTLVGAQAQAPAPGGKAPAVATSEVSGKIKSVDPAGRTVLLENGTRLMIPESVHVDPATLKAGATVKASVEDKGGQKVVTAIQVN